MSVFNSRNTKTRGFGLPLYGQILGWFFLNLLLLAAVFAFFFQFQFHFGLDFLLADKAGERVDALSGLIESELRESDPTTWNATLQRFEAAYSLRFVIFSSDGQQIAGENLPLPADIRTRLREFHGPPRPPQPLPGPLRHPEIRPQPPRAGPQPPNRKMLLHTTNPGRYWILSRALLGRFPEQEPSVLVVSSDKISFGGLLLNPLPWLAVGGGVVLLSLLFWWPLVRGITRAISQMTAATGEIAGGNFQTRAPENRTDEIGALGSSINQMAARLAGLIQGQKRFLGDTAHELVSPLARMEMALGILDQRSGGREKPYLEDVREEVQLMSRLVGELLSFSKSSLGAVHRLPIRLSDFVRETARRELGENGWRSEISPEIEVLADADLLRRAIGNVLRNAKIHAGGTGPILVSAEKRGSEIVLTLADTGVGVPEAALSQIFDPFFRLDLSRDRETGGTGLGLAITKSCIEACGGRVFARNRTGGGLEVVFTLAAVVKSNRP